MSIQELKNFGRILKYPKGQYIFQQGDTGNDMLIILSGKVGVSIASSVGGQIPITELAAGNFVGEMSVLEGQPRSADVLTLEDTVVLSIDKTNFINFMTARPEWAFKIMQALSFRLRKINERLASSQMNEEDIQKGLKKFLPPAEDNKNSGIFPEGHGIYEKQVPPEYSEYLFEKKVICPVCKEEFTVQAVKITKLRLKETARDFREKHENFDKLWYNVWVCPACCYASFSSDFMSIEKRPSEKLYPLLLEFVKTSPFRIDNHIKDIGQVFTFYYLALNTKKLMKKVDFKVGKLWLNLAWLYRDLKDEKMFKLAYHTALENYTHVLYHSHFDIAPQEEQRLYMLIGEMFIFEENLPEAIKLLQKAVQIDPKGMLANDSRDRIHILREKLKEEQQKEEQQAEENPEKTGD